MNRRTLLTYAFVSRALSQENDIFLGLVPLFRPIIHQLAGTVFSPKRFTELVDRFYGLAMTTEIAEEFIPRLVRAGLLTSRAENLERGTYLCVAAPETESEVSGHREAEKIVSDLLSAFRKFIDEFPTLLTINLTDDELVELIIDWLVKSEAALRHAELAFSESEPAASEGSDSTYKREGDYICARFIGDLADRNPKLFDELALLSAGALVSEVVLDLRSPPESGQKVVDLSVCLDGPFLMDVLGLTGTARHENATYIFQKIKAMGAHVFVFSHSTAEAAGNLRAVLKNPPYLRTGPTGDAIRRNELTEQFVIAAAADLEDLIQERGIQIVDDRIASTQNEIRYFDQETMSQFSAELISWKNEVARDRDAKSVAFVMRRRKGHRTSNLFRSKCFLLTHNPRLARTAHSFCVDEGLLYPEHIGPAVHQRRVAAMVWITVGADERLHLSRRQLVVNCANAVRTRRDVIDAMRHTLREVKPELRDQFDALLTRPRCIQLAMDLTLGVQNVVGPDNIEEVFELVKASAAEDERGRHRQEINRLRSRVNKSLNEKDIQIGALGSELERTRQLLEDAENRDRALFHTWVERSRRFGRGVALSTKAALSALIVAAVLTGAAEVQSLLPTYLNLLGIFIVAGVTIYPLWALSDDLVRDWLDRVSKRRLRHIATRAGRPDLLEQCSIDWLSGKVKWFNKTVSNDPPGTLI